MQIGYVVTIVMRQQQLCYIYCLYFDSRKQEMVGKQKLSRQWSIVESTAAPSTWRETTSKGERYLQQVFL